MFSFSPSSLPPSTRQDTLTTPPLTPGANRGGGASRFPLCSTGTRTPTAPPAWVQSPQRARSTGRGRGAAARGRAGSLGEADGQRSGFLRVSRPHGVRGERRLNASTRRRHTDSTHTQKAPQTLPGGAGRLPATQLRAPAPARARARRRLATCAVRPCSSSSWPLSTRRSFSMAAAAPPGPPLSRPLRNPGSRDSSGWPEVPVSSFRRAGSAPGGRPSGVRMRAGLDRPPVWAPAAAGGGDWGGASVLRSPAPPNTQHPRRRSGYSATRRVGFRSSRVQPSLPTPCLQESGPSGRMAIAGWMNRPTNMDPHKCPRRRCLGPRSRPADQGVQCPDQKSSSADWICITAGAVQYAGQRSSAQMHVQYLHQSLILQTPVQRRRPEALCGRPPSRPDGRMLGAGIRTGFPGGASGKNLPASAGDVRDAGSVPGSGRSPGGEHGNPLQYSCLENPTDRGAWWATVHKVAKSRTPLSSLVQCENRDKSSVLKRSLAVP